MSKQLLEAHRVMKAAEQLGVSLSSRQAEQLLQYMALLLKWNRTYNLTALRDPEQVLIQHIFDSLSVVIPFEKHLDTKKPSAAVIVDVGSGGGLPGVVLAICHPDWKITCVDAVEKKMAFVRQVSAALNLDNLSAQHGRIEALDPLNADILVSRAFASLHDFVSLGQKHVAPNGIVAAMKGQQPATEIAELEQNTTWKVIRTEPLHVPELGAQRCLVWIGRH